MSSTAAIRTYQQPNAVVFLKTKEAFGGLSNMASGYPLLVNGIRILSSEALYQACRFPFLPDVQRLIIQQTSPMTAKMVSKPYRAQSRPDWERVRVKIMRWCLRVKLAQNRQAFGKLLLETGDLPIVEKSFKDEYWGAKPSYADTLVGMNVLGRLLMELREELKSGEFDAKAFLETPAIPDFLLDGKPIEPITMNQKAFTLSLQPTLFDPMPTTAPETTLATTMQTFPKYETYKDSGIEWLGEIPDSWELTKLGTCLTPVSKKNRADLPLLSITREQGVIERDIEDAESNHNFIPDDLSGYKVLEKGQFGMNKMKAWQGSYGVSKHTGIVSPAYFVFDFAKVIDPIFFNWAIRSKLYVSYFGSASDGVRIGQWDLSKSRMKAIPFLLPSPEEQTAIAHFIDQKTAQIDAAIAIKEQQIALLKERKQILIQQAVTQGLEPTVPMKDSGVEWIGESPEHWECTEIRKFARTTSGSTPQSGNVNAYYNGNIPWVRTTDLNDDELMDVPEKITERALRETSCKLIPENSVCVAMYGGSGTIGKHAILRFSGTLNQAVCGIMPSKKISQEYLYYYVKFYRPHWMIVAKGSRVDPNISQDQVKRMPITLPPLKEQNRIVCFIDSECKKFSELIDLEYQQIEKLREYKTTLINSAVTGKIRVTNNAVDVSI